MKAKLNLSQALPLAEKIKTTLSPACDRIEIAGSIRRRAPIVGDIEIVAIPKMCPDLEAQPSLFGEPQKMVSALDPLLEKLVSEKPHFKWGSKNGELYKNFRVQFNSDGAEIALDLFITTPPQWGYIFALRTGPGDFNKAWVTQQSKGGLLPDEYRFEGGWLVGPDGQRIPTPEEIDIFGLLGEGQIMAPENRDNWRCYATLSPCRLPGGWGVG
jgi:DNA polymerase/3'-5' exonuclease PolX